jgi:hypothetical protein
MLKDAEEYAVAKFEALVVPPTTASLATGEVVPTPTR